MVNSPNLHPIVEVIKGGGEAISVTVYSPKRKLRETAKNYL